MKHLSTLRRYFLTALACALAVPVAQALDAPVSCLFLAVAASCLYGGRGPGTLSVVLSALAFDYFFVPPLYRFGLAPSSYLRFAVFLSSTILIAMLIDGKRLVEEARERIAAQMRRNESYLVEAQRLSQTGSFGWDTSTGELFWSEEAFRIVACDPAVKPSLAFLIRQVHPEDRERIESLLDRASRSGSDLDLKYRLLLPDQSVKHVHLLAHAATENGVIHYVGAMMDITGGVQAAEDLRRSETYLAEAQKLSHTASWVWDVTRARPVYWSAELYRIYNRDPALGPISPEQSRALHSSEDWARLLEAIECSVRDGRVFDVEDSLSFPDGSVKHLRILGRPVLNAAGGVTQLMGTLMDVTEQHHARAALQKALAEVRSSEDQLRQIINTIPGLICTKTPAGEIELVNRPILDYTGKTLDELKDWPAMFHPDDRDRTTSQWAQSVKTGRPLEDEFRLRRADGVYRWFQSRMLPQHDAQDRIVRWYGLFTDIEDRKIAEEALRSSERELSLIIETIPALVWCAGPNGDLTYVNHRVLEYTGVTLSALAQSGWLDFLHPDDVEPTKQAWWGAVATGRQHDVQYRLRRADGAYHWFQVLGQPIRDRDDRLTRWYGLLIDIDDRKNVEDALRRTQSRLSRATQVATVGEFAASIAHEINQPLAAVVANGHACLRWLSADPPCLPKAHEAALRIVRDGKDAGEVVRRIRALFKRASVEKMELHMNEIIAEVISLLASETSRRRVVVETELEPNLPAVVGDHVQVQQLLFNLLTNGIEAMEPLLDFPKKLRIRSRRHCPDAILVEIRDHGIGLPDPDRVFEAFFTTKEKGMGMGLAICRSIVEEHKGRLWASPADGAGTTFCFTLQAKAGSQP